MTNPARLIFPGFISGVLSLVLLTSLISVNESAQAYTNTDGRAITAVASSAPTKLTLNNQGSGTGSKDTCRLPARYPNAIRRWCGLIEINAKEFDLESSLIAAVMLQESGGDPSATSKSGAVGLLQVMPRDGIAATFQCKNGPCFAARPSMEELYDPTFNIKYGARMLAGLVRKLGSVREALKAYGPMDVGYSYADKVLSIYRNY